ncbi:MAG TPA: type II secretion system protein GspD [Candidatus Paceibacterota bacterium]|nr:type II secretion system protein GspD [Verrucomicrobiota bacterium]HRZ43787.1 type II secretion system protein GspD [Candidatus Paceibacterota bacterium]
MPSKPDPTREERWRRRTWLALALALLPWLAGCRQTQVAERRPAAPPPGLTEAAASSAPAAPAPAPGAETNRSAQAELLVVPPQAAPNRGQPTLAEKLAGPPVAFSPNYDRELREIIGLAQRNQWGEAEARAAALYALDPRDPSVMRVYNWVRTEGPKRREKELEDQIRDISSRNTRFEPTVGSLLTEPPSRGLPPRSELRNAIDQIKAAPYIPESYGRTIEMRGTLEDFRSQRGRMAALLDREVAVHVNDVTLENIIFQIGQAEGINFVADRSLAAFQQKLTVNMQRARLGDFLEYAARNLGIQFQVGDGLIWITDAKDVGKTMEMTRFYKLREGFVLPAQFGISDTTKTSVTANNVTTETEVQKFEHFVRDGAAKTPSIEAVIRKFFRGSKFQIDHERNLLVARGTEEQLALLERIIREFDRPVQQVLIEARFITVSESKLLQLGMIWESGRNPLAVGRSPTDFTGLAEGSVGLGLEESWYGILDRETLSATLTALDQGGESETLSAPRVTLINNLPATISDGKIQYYYEEYTVTQTILEQRTSTSLVPKGKPTKLNSGVTLDVVASIGGDGQSVLLALRPRVTQDVNLVTFATITDKDSSGNVVNTFDIKLPEYREQSLATRVAVRSGQTVVMGGVSQREQLSYIEAVPVLSRIPLIGAAFRRRTEVDQPRYLLVFVTATLLSEKGEFMVTAE